MHWFGGRFHSSLSKWYKISKKYFKNSAKISQNHISSQFRTITWKALHFASSSISDIFFCQNFNFFKKIELSIDVFHTLSDFSLFSSISVTLLMRWHCAEKREKLRENYDFWDFYGKKRKNGIFGFLAYFLKIWTLSKWDKKLLNRSIEAKKSQKVIFLKLFLSRNTESSKHEVSSFRRFSHDKRPNLQLTTERGVSESIS